MPITAVHPPTSPLAPPSTSLPPLLQTPSGLALLELQGTIQAPGASTDADATEVGKLVFPLHTADTPPGDGPWMKRVYLYVGKHQRLTGEVKKLPQAVAVLRRRETEDPTVPEGDAEVEVVDVVKYKLVFSSRPEPVGDDV
ncbi:hypothetical protein EJ06DRAFT_525530 [Trichodelitschia bisporula]|uniref:Sister chromatid cohesion protein Ctf8 n=1 Tax=Trichodelitschia bisporula TaxID=703511 RepID=A0A6G1I9V0_9PEZI|nr:hypothetical protein EJ06DRAFT_525530 [Trichodelitschia bisporula]